MSAFGVVVSLVLWLVVAACVGVIALLVVMILYCLVVAPVYDPAGLVGSLLGV